MPYKGKEQVEKDTASILSAFKHGKVNGHFRYFFMATNNTRNLTDYYANAAGEASGLKLLLFMDSALPSEDLMFLISPPQIWLFRIRPPDYSTATK